MTKANQAGARAAIEAVKQAASTSLRFAGPKSTAPRKARPDVWGCRFCGLKYGPADGDGCKHCGSNEAWNREQCAAHLSVVAASCGCDFCERAAIIEFEAKVSREAAERLTVDEFFPLPRTEAP